MIFIWNEVFFKPIYNILIWIVSMLPGHNLGWAIVILTILIRVLLYIPTYKALRAQTNMQELQPKIQDLRKKYKNDQQKLSEETLKLYKENGVNPCGSCLPIIIQMPILIAVFQVLRIGATSDTSEYLYTFLQNFDYNMVVHSFYWVSDLTVPEKLILPILVGLTQFISMWLMQHHSKKNNLQSQKKSKKKQNIPDPAKEMEMATKMMTYVLPFMVAWFAYQYPAGLALYWFVSTLFGIGQQFLLQRRRETLKQEKDTSKK